MREARGPEWTDWLAERGIVALTGIDTRSLVLRLREGGAMRAAAVAGTLRRDRGARRRPRAAVDGRRRARRPGLDSRAVRLLRRGHGPGRRRRLRLQALDPAPARRRGRAVTVYPAHRRRRRARRPRRRAALERARRPRAARRRGRRSSATLLGRVPILGICLGHQLLALATGHETFKLRSATAARITPCSTRATGRVLVTSQNHGFAVAPSDDAEATHVSLYDGTVEGFDFPDLRARSVQFHPEAGPGPARRLADPRALGRGDPRGEAEMPRRQDISSICLIGSGPIVIGQACEFDYAGCQALKVLREDGFRTIVVNSNPATIMTDPGFADRPTSSRSTSRASPTCSGASGPTRCCRRSAARRRSTSRIELADEGVLDELGVELLGAPVDVIRRAEDRELFREAVQSCGLAVPSSRIVTSLDDLDGVAVPAVVRPAFTLGGHGGGFVVDRGRAARTGRARARREPDRPGARRGVGAGLGRVRARGDPRPPRQRRHRLLDREPRPDGRPHRRLGHGRAADDALGRGLPGAARRGDRRDPRGRRRDRRLEHPVRARSRDRRAPRDRDEPARLALVRARVEGDRLPDREGRRQARRRLHARRDPERPDEDDARELRADARLRRRQVPALRVREVPRRRHDARHADEVGRRGDGDRAHLPGGVREGVREPRARRRRGHALGDARRPAGGPAPLVPPRARRSCAAKAGRPRAARLPPCRLLRRRGRRRLELLLLDPRRGGRGAAGRRRSRASSSSAPARTGSARGSSSTTAASTPRRASARSATRR